MKLQEVLDHLKAAEFSQLNFGAGQGVIDTDEAIEKVMSHVNLGLTDLFTRFELRVRKIMLQLQPDQTSYLLISTRASTKYKPTTPPAEPAPPPYILDTVDDPFNDDVLLMTRVYTDSGYELPINCLDKPHSLLTSAMNRLEVPMSIVNYSQELPPQLLTKNLAITYRANHKIMNPNVGSFVPERMELELPYSHMTALLYYVASRANNPVGLGQEFNAGNTYAAKYEAECARLKNDGMEVQQRGNQDKFNERGFV